MNDTGSTALILKTGKFIKTVLFLAMPMGSSRFACRARKPGSATATATAAAPAVLTRRARHAVHLPMWLAEQDGAHHHGRADAVVGRGQSRESDRCTAEPGFRVAAAPAAQRGLSSRPQPCRCGSRPETLARSPGRPLQSILGPRVRARRPWPQRRRARPERRGCCCGQGQALQAPEQAGRPVHRVGRCTRGCPRGGGPGLPHPRGGSRQPGG